MKKYIARRLFLFVPTLIGVSIAIFVLLRIIPGDVAAAILAGPTGEGTYTQEELADLRELMGLNDPIFVQYFNWAWGFVRGDLGDSVALGRPIMDEIKRQLPVSLQVGFLSLAIIFMIAIPVGILAAIKQDSWTDYIVRGVAIWGLAMPSFFVGLLIVLALSRGFHWLPPIAFANLWDDPVVSIQQLIFPALALGFSSNGVLLRITRTQLLEVLREDYIRTARAKGLADKVVILRHAVRNSLLPVVTVAGFQFGLLFSGVVVIELVFNIPGVGRGLTNALFGRDLTLIQAYVMYLALMSLAANLIVDLIYAWLDPRIRYA